MARRTSTDEHRAILRQCVVRSLRHVDGGYDSAVEHGFFAAVVQISGTDWDSLTRARCKAVFPEVEMWKLDERQYLPAAASVIRACGGTPSAVTLQTGTGYSCDSLDGWDYWYHYEGDTDYQGRARATPVARLAKLKKLFPLIEVSPPDEYELEGADAETAAAFAAWVARRR